MVLLSLLLLLVCVHYLLFWFFVEVVNVNDAPVVVAFIPYENEDQGFGSFTVDLSGVFSDPDGDDIQLFVSSSDTDLVTVSVDEDDLLTVTEVGNGGIGTSIITITASDGVLSTSTTFNVNIGVNTVENRSEYFGSFTVDLSGLFGSDDGITFTNTNDYGFDVSLLANGTTLLVAEDGGLVCGEAETTIITTSGDPGGYFGGGNYVIQVINGNVNDQPQLVNPVADQTYSSGFGTDDIDASNVFTDVDCEDLTLTAVSSDEEVATVTTSGTGTYSTGNIDGYLVTITEVGTGTTTITLTVEDEIGATATDQFTVTIN